MMCRAATFVMTSPRPLSISLNSLFTFPESITMPFSTPLRRSPSCIRSPSPISTMPFAASMLVNYPHNRPPPHLPRAPILPSLNSKLQPPNCLHPAGLWSTPAGTIRCRLTRRWCGRCGSISSSFDGRRLLRCCTVLLALVLFDDASHAFPLSGWLHQRHCRRRGITFSQPC